MTAPSRHSPSVTRNSHLSFSKRLGIAFLRVGCVLRIALHSRFIVALQLVNKLLENAAAMFVILELIKTCARWRQKYDVSAVSHLSGQRNSTVQSSRPADRHATFNLFSDFFPTAPLDHSYFAFFSK